MNNTMNNMIENLIKSNCIKIGNFKLKNGENSKYYFDIKNIISNPSLLRWIGDELYNILGKFDIISVFFLSTFPRPVIKFCDIMFPKADNGLFEDVSSFRVSSASFNISNNLFIDVLASTLENS